MKNIVIIGAGISGLATAYYLKKQSEEKRLDISITVLEKSSRIGGNINTISEDGFIFDGGPRGFLAEGRRTLELCNDLGLWNEILLSSDYSKIRYVWRNNKLNPLPAKPFDIFKSEVIGWKEIRTILLEFFKRNSPETDDESVADFIRRRFSGDILDNFVELIITGIYAGDPSRLSAKSIFPRLKELENNYKSILRGFIKSSRKHTPQLYNEKINKINKRKLISLKGGMQTLVSRLSEYLSNYIYLNTNITSIEYQSAQTAIINTDLENIRKLKADHIIFAAPAYVTAQYVDPLSNALSNLLYKIEYAPIHVACFGYRKKIYTHKGFGFLIPRKEGLKMLGCIWNEMVYPEYAPEGGGNLTLMYGGASHPEMRSISEYELIDQSKTELKRTMEIENNPDYTYCFHYEKGIPQYNIGYSKIIQEIESITKKNPHISLIGNYINGVGMNDCIRNAYDLVHKMEL